MSEATRLLRQHFESASIEEFAVAGSANRRLVVTRGSVNQILSSGRPSDAQLPFGVGLELDNACIVTSAKAAGRHRHRKVCGGLAVDEKRKLRLFVWHEIIRVRERHHL